jgi:hypothetical protein
MQLTPPEASESCAVAVGQDEDALPFVAGTHVGCAHTDPLRIEPEVGQVAENKGQSASGNKGRHVFQEHEVGSNFAQALDDVRPDPSLVLDAVAFAGGAPGLTRESSRDAIHASTPASAVEGE